MSIGRAPLVLCVLLAAAVSARGPASPSAAAASGFHQRAAQSDDPDRLFAQRDPLSVSNALGAWKRRLAARPTDAEAAWKGARADYWLGTNGEGPRNTRRPFLEDGITLARRAMAIAPAEPHGHFWLAANMGTLSELFGRREGLKYRDDIRKALQTVIAAEPGYMQGAAARALGRWHASVPAIFGGNKKDAETHFRAALRYKADSVITLTLYGELLADLKRTDEARRQFEAALEAPSETEWAPEDERFRTRARERLAATRSPASGGAEATVLVHATAARDHRRYS